MNPDLWTDYGRTSPRMASARVKGDGTFVTGALIEGDYYMVAIPDDQAVEWQDPATLAKLAKIAKQLTVRDGETSHENLKLERLK